MKIYVIFLSFLRKNYESLRYGIFTIWELLIPLLSYFIHNEGCERMRNWCVLSLSVSKSIEKQNDAICAICSDWACIWMEFRLIEYHYKKMICLTKVLLERWTKFIVCYKWQFINWINFLDDLNRKRSNVASILNYYNYSRRQVSFHNGGTKQQYSTVRKKRRKCFDFVFLWPAVLMAFENIGLYPNVNCALAK